MALCKQPGKASLLVLMGMPGAARRRRAAGIGISDRLTSMKLAAGQVGGQMALADDAARAHQPDP